jgi:ketosteroid isomerase-like protein
MHDTNNQHWWKRLLLRSIITGLVLMLIPMIYYWTAYGRSTPVDGNAVMIPDSKSEQEILNEMHKMHEAFDRGDIETIANSLANEDFLFVYELDANSKPVKLNTKDELIEWLHKTFKTFETSGAITAAKNPVMAVRANSTFGMVTEECALKVQMPGGKTQVQSLRATAVARKASDGWKWIHWHMSASAPRTIIEIENGTNTVSAINIAEQKDPKSVKEKLTEKETPK